ncbi:MAG: methyltransferase domain-containing protein [Alphaproteobacteria bacterium]|nr:methyltransferase domain-containing protein [Alphaproteobacteria bacterium]
MDSYDRLPYDTKPGRAMHPARLLALARRSGLACAGPDTARVLEIGCGTGANLVPIAAAYPRAEVVGIDLSPVQIGMAAADARALGLSVRFETLDLHDLRGDPFDLILCHGVYSWIDDPTRDALMERVRGLLAPSGVAFVSWNALPGWHVRGALRELLRQHVADEPDLLARVAMARDLLVALASSPLDAGLGALLRDRAAHLLDASDTYLAHDYLAPHNTAVYRRDFVAHAARVGLSVLCEAEPGSDAAPPGTDDVMRLAHDPAQMADFLAGRAFHRSVLCRDDAVFGPPDATGMAFRGVLEPGGAEGSAMRFSRRGVPVMATENRLLAVALTVLAERAPAAIAADALEAVVTERIGIPGTAPLLRRALDTCVEHGFVELLLDPPAIPTRLGARPRAWSVARHYAARGQAWVPSLVHEAVAINALDASLLALLDGQNDRAAVLDALVGRHPGLTREELEVRVPGRLAMMVASGLFEPQEAP